MTQPTAHPNPNFNVVALAGGVGGAKLAAGLQAVLPPGNLTVIVNTGDDFEHWGLTICPDLDTVMYNLAGVHNPEMGWGRAGESFAVLEETARLAGEDWFRLGDRDLALHLRRSHWLRQGLSLCEVTDRLRRSLGVASTILPMSDSPVPTLVHTDQGDLPFQHYFVRLRCEPVLVDLSFVGAEQASPPAAALDAIHNADLIVICPSNPYVSIDPILSIPGMREAIRSCPRPVIGVSPIVGGHAIKGPAAKMMKELGEMVSPLTVADHLQDILDAFVIDDADSDVAAVVGFPTLVTNTIMHDDASRASLARAILAFADEFSWEKAQAAGSMAAVLAPTTRLVERQP
ncbi:MAG: 2-phospho-L-lactate transferase [Caldilineaceae bacterium]|nr:2-phospho-L-lactate transferase [Caldilineaceae bacterium]